MNRLHRLRECLVSLDAKFDSTVVRHSLSGREQATPLVALFDRHADGLDEELREAFGRGLLRAATAQLEAFPRTIFWDLDALAGHLAAGALNRTDGRAYLARTTATVASLQHLFGHDTPIHFRYVHDFTYGFDWAKWVARDPETRQTIGPYDEPFLRYMWRRGHELLLLIANDDEKYPKLPSGRPRNPFAFSRDPEDERRLFTDLASADLIPVKAWDASPTLTWNRPFQELRRQRAEALGITRS